MAALVSIGATSESSQKRRKRTRYFWAQYGLIGIAGFLGYNAVGIPRVILVVGFLAACVKACGTGFAASLNGGSNPTARVGLEARMLSNLIGQTKHLLVVGTVGGNGSGVNLSADLIPKLPRSPSSHE